MPGSPATVTGKWLGRDLVFFHSGDSHTWYGLGGIDVETAPGTYSLALEATGPNSEIAHATRDIIVRPSKYKTVALHVPNKFVEPDAETLQRIQADKAIKDVAFAHEINVPEWSGKFQPPVASTASDSFGTRRMFNGKLASIHRGTDYHAATGTVVRAANSGEVILARGLFYEGNFVVIDHGLGFMTMYMHLSKINVREGQKAQHGRRDWLERSYRTRHRTASAFGSSMARRLHRSSPAYDAGPAGSALSPALREPG